MHHSLDGQGLQAKRAGPYQYAQVVKVESCWHRGFFERMEPGYQASVFEGILSRRRQYVLGFPFVQSMVPRVTGGIGVTSGCHSP